jgi:hypothetical protein
MATIEQLTKVQGNAKATYIPTSRPLKEIGDAARPVQGAAPVEKARLRAPDAPEMPRPPKIGTLSLAQAINNLGSVVGVAGSMMAEKYAVDVKLQIGEYNRELMGITDDDEKLAWFTSKESEELTSVQTEALNLFGANNAAQRLGREAADKVNSGSKTFDQVLAEYAIDAKAVTENMDDNARKAFEAVSGEGIERLKTAARAEKSAKVQEALLVEVATAVDSLVTLEGTDLTDAVGDVLAHTELLPQSIQDDFRMQMVEKAVYQGNYELAKALGSAERGDQPGVESLPRFAKRFGQLETVKASAAAKQEREAKALEGDANKTAFAIEYGEATENQDWFKDTYGTQEALTASLAARIKDKSLTKTQANDLMRIGRQQNATLLLSELGPKKVRAMADAVASGTALNVDPDGNFPPFDPELQVWKDYANALYPGETEIQALNGISVSNSKNNASNISKAERARVNAVHEKISTGIVEQLALDPLVNVANIEPIITIDPVTGRPRTMSAAKVGQAVLAQKMENVKLAQESDDNTSGRAPLANNPTWLLEQKAAILNDTQIIDTKLKGKLSLAAGRLTPEDVKTLEDFKETGLTEQLMVFEQLYAVNPTLAERHTSSEAYAAMVAIIDRTKALSKDDSIASNPEYYYRTAQTIIGQINRNQEKRKDAGANLNKEQKDARALIVDNVMSEKGGLATTFFSYFSPDSKAPVNDRSGIRDFVDKRMKQFMDAGTHSEEEALAAVEELAKSRFDTYNGRAFNNQGRQLTPKRRLEIQDVELQMVELYNSVLGAALSSESATEFEGMPYKPGLVPYSADGKLWRIENIHPDAAGEPLPGLGGVEYQYRESGEVKKIRLDYLIPLDVIDKLSTALKDAEFNDKVSDLSTGSGGVVPNVNLAEDLGAGPYDLSSGSGLTALTSK